jgi:hypothetical protein
MYRVARFSLVVLAVAGIVYAADSPFAGTWKLNLARSEFAGTTMTFEQAGAGAMKLTAEGQAYTFTMDGKDSLTPFSYSAAWTQVDAVTWQTVYKLPGAGAVMSTDTTKLSADGKALTVTSRGTMPNGERFENVAVYQRVSGATGLAGTWKTTKVQQSSPDRMEIAPYEGDGLAWKIVAYEATVNAKFDGKDYLATGPMLPPGFTLAMRKIGERSFDLIQKLKGKVIYRGTYTLSADGKTLTVVSAAEGTQEKVKAVYERQ